MFDVSKNAILKLLAEVGTACAEYQDKAMQNLNCKRLQADEIWQFCYSKEKNVPIEKRGEFGYGDVWTWAASDADTKLVPSFLVGRRDAGCATAFIQDLAGRLKSRVQLTTDGLKLYLNAVADGFGSDIDYAMLIKTYGIDPQGEKRYSPAICAGCEQKTIKGNPDCKHISTSYIERQNLTMRMHMRRFTRLTNGHSKKIENHMYAVALHFMFYNFAKIHQTLRVTPAMAAGISDHIWSIADIVALTNSK
jgi:IS1 family transposase